jgi:hypothetical protein
MSENVGMKILITADAEDAKKDIDELEAKAERVKDIHRNRATTSSPLPPDPPKGKPSIDEKAARKAGEEFGKTAAGAIAKAATGFLLHDVSSLAFKWARIEGEDNTSVNRANAAVNGAVTLGTSGAMVGGPWGAAIGGLAGAITGLAGALADERNARRATAISMWHNAHASNEAVNANIGSAALARLMAFTGSRSGKDAILRDQLTEQAKLLSQTAARLKGIRDKSSTEYQYQAGEHARLSSLYSQSLSAWALHRLENMSRERVSASEITDSWGKRGIYYGSQIDMADINSTASRHTDMMSVLREIVSATNTGAAANGERLQSLLELIARSSTL